MHLARGSFPAESVVRINLPILGFSVGVALACGMLFGLAPALRLSRPELAPAIQSTIRRIAGQHRNRRLSVLIGAQAALTLLLMASGAMAIGAFFRVSAASAFEFGEEQNCAPSLRKPSALVGFPTFMPVAAINH
jgi:hypothetical protein